MSRQRERSFESAFAPLLSAMSSTSETSFAGDSLDDDSLMRLALEEAWQGVGRTAPNPPVGAVVAHAGRVLSKGFHRRAGGPHAEVDALSKLENVPSDASIYVTLEPCVHFGRTAPCTQRIIDSGLKRVVIGCRDPNPKVNGKGMRALREAGVDVEMIANPAIRQSAEALIKPFRMVTMQKRPYVIAKIATTMDGRVATHSGASRWITEEPARRLVHYLRNRVDGVMVGSGTVLADNPSLNVRFHQKGSSSRNPRRIVIDSGLKTDPNAPVYHFHSRDGRHASPIVFHQVTADDTRKASFDAMDVRRIELQSTTEHVPLKDVWPHLNRLDLTSVLVEAGPALLTQLLKEEQVDELWWFLAPKIIGSDGIPATRLEGVDDMSEALSFKNARWHPVGRDLLSVIEL